jgi:hypothetical protein
MRRGLMLLLVSLALPRADAQVAPKLPGQLPHHDQLGDSLPDCVIARMGTTRLRETDTVAALCTLQCGHGNDAVENSNVEPDFVTVRVIAALDAAVEQQPGMDTGQQVSTRGEHSASPRRGCRVVQLPEDVGTGAPLNQTLCIDRLADLALDAGVGVVWAAGGPGVDVECAGQVLAEPLAEVFGARRRVVRARGPCAGR